MEDLPVRKIAMVVWGLPGVAAGVAGFIAASSLSGEHDAHLVRLIELLVVPCAVLIGAAIVAITFAADWEMTPEQARRRDELVISSGFLSVFAVLAIMAAGFYVALAPGIGRFDSHRRRECGDGWYSCGITVRFERRWACYAPWSACAACKVPDRSHYR